MRPITTTLPFGPRLGPVPEYLVACAEEFLNGGMVEVGPAQPHGDRVRFCVVVRNPGSSDAFVAEPRLELFVREGGLVTASTVWIGQVDGRAVLAEP